MPRSASRSNGFMTTLIFARTSRSRRSSEMRSTTSSSRRRGRGRQRPVRRRRRLDRLGVGNPHRSIGVRRGGFPEAHPPSAAAGHQGDRAAAADGHAAGSDRLGGEREGGRGGGGRRTDADPQLADAPEPGDARLRALASVGRSSPQRSGATPPTHHLRQAARAWPRQDAAHPEAGIGRRGTPLRGLPGRHDRPSAEA